MQVHDSIQYARAWHLHLFTGSLPVVSVARDALFERLGNWYGAQPGQPSKPADDKFDEVCFRYGIELDDVTSEKKIIEKETGKDVGGAASDEILYKIDVPANRYDILCLEGLSRALNIFNGKPAPVYKVTKPAVMQRMIVSKEHPPHLRPIVVCAVLRNIKFTQRNYNSFIDLQEKLHQNICRKRTLVSIGTHDLDTIKGPFSYQARKPKDIKFAPLNNKQVFDGEELMKHFDANEIHLKKFLPIIRDSPVYPVIYDSNNVVLSLPPIINGDHSKITLNTKNVFIEITATDLTKAEIVLNIMCTMFAEYCSDPFSIEPVEVVELDGTVHVYPNVAPRETEVSIDYINKSIGIDLKPEAMAEVLTKMSLSATVLPDKKQLKVSIPCTRSDILHACDVMEDVAIAYGYDNLKREIPKTLTYGKQQPLNKLTDLLRLEVAMAGYSEALTLSLCSREENFAFLNKKDDNSAVTLSNPQTAEFQVARTSLLVGILKTVSHNRGASLPIKVFEISDVVLKTAEKDVGAINKRHLCALYCNHNSGFEVIHGLVDTIFTALGVKWKGQQDASDAKGTKYYELKASEDPTFFPGRRADILVNGTKVGVVGTVHPEVLEKFHVPFPCSAVELFIEPFV